MIGREWRNRRRRRRDMAVLGMLFINVAFLDGYQIWRRIGGFAAGIYASLERLEAAGLVERCEDESTGYLYRAKR